ncbi:MAG TPA: sigma-70 family RNA polymerase sigma factor [Rubrivivax sp.]|jgi:RNA polymerase sigma-70 factor (ECF subfamily)|nr:sigma-70 family RNA polymerase sigma factor [Burkholderiaceae bacterium]HMQ72843.1 sigma-70 family RNA polymerase sigma factor [Rubrivivax sp.]HMR70767.1 sigma-70 family RNA polymerase sigma factor [Rubrivivax sp.]
MRPTASPQRAARRAAAAPAQAAAERDRQLAALIADAARGDASAFESFYDATYGYARAVARRVLGAGDLDDLLADAFFEAWRKAAAFDVARGSAVTWLLTIVRSRALDLLRQRASHPRAGARLALDEGDDDGADAAAASGADTDPGEWLWRRESGSRLHAAVQALSPAERWALGLAYWRELSHAEIAAATGWPLGTVKSHLLRAQHKLREALSR